MSQEQCKWGNEDCENNEKRCYACNILNFHYVPKKIKSNKGLNKRQAKANDRKGSSHELVNHNKNKDLLSGATSRLTPNSGAGKVKGDEEIRGIINIMEELKQQKKVLTKGNMSFSIQKEWLEKLNREAIAANKEFWYLKFSYNDDNKSYITVDEDIIMAMVFTMAEDRKTKILSEAKLDVVEKSRRLLETENIRQAAEIEYLKSKLKLQDLQI